MMCSMVIRSDQNEQGRDETPGAVHGSKESQGVINASFRKKRGDALEGVVPLK